MDLQEKWRQSVNNYEQSTFNPSDKIKHWKEKGVYQENIIDKLIQNAKIHADMFKSYITEITPGKTILDVGCGNGFMYGKSYEEVGYNYYPFNVNVYGCDVIENKFLPNFKKTRAEELPYDNNVFDAAVCVSALPHFYDPMRVFREIYRVVKPGSTFFLSCETVEKPSKEPNPNHLYEFTPIAILGLYWQAGFRNLSYQGVINLGEICFFRGERLQYV